MTDPERRAGELRTLIARIRRDLAVVHRINERIDRAVGRWESAEDGPADPELTAATALHLETLYTAVEGLFGRVANTMEGSLPKGDDWHRLLLEQMTLDIEGVRPAVIDADLARQLDLLRRFRHRIRHAYEEELDRQRMAEVLAARVAALDALPSALESIETFLDRAARTLEE